MKKQKRIKLKHGTAHVDENCSPETIESLNTLADLACSMGIESIQIPKAKIDIQRAPLPNTPTHF